LPFLDSALPRFDESPLRGAFREQPLESQRKSHPVESIFAMSPVRKSSLGQKPLPPDALLKKEGRKRTRLAKKSLAKVGLARSRRSGAVRLPRPGRPEAAARADLVRPAPAPKVAANGVNWLPVAGWNLPWLWSGFSTRRGGLSHAGPADEATGAQNLGGELNLGFTADDARETVAANRRLLVEAITGNASAPLITVRQFHSNLLVHATAADATRERPRKADGLICAEPGLLLGVQTADCIPVLVVDRLPRRLARNGETHRRDRRWTHAARIRLAPRRPHRRHRPRHRRLLLRGG
jgi:hypothetical protein